MTDTRGEAQSVKKWNLPAAALACLLLCGCASLLERDYSVVEPYANRYWDTGAEDTLRAESYQDLVNSLLMLVEERAEEGTIRCYGEASAPQQAQAASREVRLESTLGSYLLRRITYSFEAGTGYSTLQVQMTYREDAEDVENIMTLSDSQSLVDLLRLAVREEHEKLTARFSYDTPREDVTAAVESLWQELCRESVETVEPAAPEEEAETAAPEENQGTEDQESAPAPEEPGEEPGEVPPAPAENQAPLPEDPGAEEPPAQLQEPQYPPCPWTVRFYPDKAAAELVEVLLG